MLTERLSAILEIDFTISFIYVRDRILNTDVVL